MRSRCSIGGALRSGLLTIAVGAVGAAILSPAGATNAQGNVDVAQALLSGVVELHGGAADRPLLGSGFLVHFDEEHALVVTANHVVDGADRVEVAFRDRATSRYQTSLVAASVDLDLALLRVNWAGRQRPAPPPRFVVTANPSANESLFVLGSAGDLHWARTSPGVLTQVTDPANINRFRFDRGTTEQGFSGGPVIEATTGRLVGVLQRLVGQQALALKIDAALQTVDSSWGVPELNQIERRSTTSSRSTAGNRVGPTPAPSSTRTFRQIEFQVMSAEAQGSTLTVTLSVVNTGIDRELRASPSARCATAAEIIDDKGKTYTTSRVRLGSRDCGSTLLNGVATTMVVTFSGMATVGGATEASEMKRLTLPSLDVARQERGSIDFLNIPIRKPQ